MEQIRVKITHSDSLRLRVSIDDVRLEFDSDGIGTRHLARGPHRMTWSALGSQGQKYKVCVQRPSRILCCPDEVTLDQEGIDHSFCNFDIL